MKKLKYLVLDPEASFRDVVFLENDDLVDVIYNGQIFYKKKIDFFEQFDMVLCVHGGNPINLYVLSKCYGVCTTVLVADGVYEWDNAYRNPKTRKSGVDLYDPILVNYFLHVGNRVDYLKFVNPNSIFLSYVPKRMRSVLCEGGRWVQPKEKRCNKLLVTSAKSPFFDVLERSELVELYRDVIKEARTVFDVVDLRIFDDEFFIDITKDFGAFENVKEGAFGSILEDYVAVVTTTSSISLEVMRKNIPLAHIDVRDSPLFVQAGWRITGSVNIAAVLSSMLLSDVHRMAFQSSQVQLLVEPEVAEVGDLIDRAYLTRFEPSEIKDLHASLVLQSKWNLNLKVFVKRVLSYFK
ncbi:hypothetical protein CN03_05495 [Thalassolituus oleivorans]|uniref:hypothetical protein n=1 Tax=Thalassolituus oleivorans TaxID=187493 RepID=UPI00094944FC|nr:hypothetical protein [Thalassolituus oleivorans]APR66439.1 hypothetical protein CN03_05495 [Thalassolituus oleivorans]